jgi:hypothetical protein
LRSFFRALEKVKIRDPLTPAKVSVPLEHPFPLECIGQAQFLSLSRGENAVFPPLREGRRKSGYLIGAARELVLHIGTAYQ